MSVSTPPAENLQIELVCSPPDGTPYVLTGWSEYEFNSSFTTPADGFSFSLGVARFEDIPTFLRDFDYRTRVQLQIDGKPQATGYIDSVEFSTTKGSGINIRIRGRDVMGQAVDACMDPRVHFKPEHTLEYLLQKVLFPYGFKNISVDPDKNRAIVTGNERAKRNRQVPKPSKKGRVRKTNYGKPTSSVKLYQCRAKDREGAFAFASRVSQRHGLWLWAAADGETLIVGLPTFDQAPIYELYRGGAGTNMLSCSVTTNVANQPTLIVADGFTQASEFTGGGAQFFAINPDVTTTAELQEKELALLTGVVPELEPIADTARVVPIKVPQSKILYLHDNASKTAENLEWFLLREMAHFRRDALTVNVEVEGHGQIVDGVFTPWAVDTVVDFRDDLSGISRPLYVVSRTFRRSKDGGTKTSLELINLWSLSFEGNGE